MFVSDKTTQARGLSIFLKNLERSFARAGKKLAINVTKNPVRTLEIGLKFDITAVSKTFQAALSTITNEIKFNHTGKGLYLWKFA